LPVCGFGEGDRAAKCGNELELTAILTGDEQWIHIDVERAKQELPLQSTIAHGLLTVSLVPEFVRSVMRLEGIKNTINYGANRIRYSAESSSRQQMMRRPTGCGSPMMSQLKSKAVSGLLASPK
jgi:hypothetical protein